MSTPVVTVDRCRPATSQCETAAADVTPLNTQTYPAHTNTLSSTNSRQKAIRTNYSKLLCGAAAQRVECWTCNQQVVGSDPTTGKSCVTTLGKLFTPMCLVKLLSLHCTLMTKSFFIVSLLNYLKVAQRVERWTCDQQVVGSDPTRSKSCVTTLDKLFTPIYASVTKQYNLVPAKGW